MDSETFEELLGIVAPLIAKQNTCMRDAITPNMRLSSTLRYLATGEKFEDLKFLTVISPRSLGVIVIETCEAIISCLSNAIKVPQSEIEWKAIADGFEEIWNFPNCLGAIDGKHIAIKRPPNSGALYYNYKKFYSIVLMATVNANYEFIVADVGTNGRVSDGGVIKNTEFGKAIYNKTLPLPGPSQLPKSDKVLPYVFVADNAFQMQGHLIKPYPGTNLTNTQRIFNYRLSRARRIVENVFGILVSRFGVLQTTIQLAPEKAQIIVLACCYLHNFLRKKKSYSFSHLIDQEDENSGSIAQGAWRRESHLNVLESAHLRNSSNKAKEIRNNFAEYFINEGAVSWQQKYLR
ncbi:putative nuclease HARBI1 [Anastrepha obliqua]|uniref:putative nuclease HARBI1 n=1 Tax=Anastrepha obliqua TaxID=95512 RepID=UPI00240A9A43|nr:putative nuclease HARBI1 [Anastrepha obliqua]